MSDAPAQQKFTYRFQNGSGNVQQDYEVGTVYDFKKGDTIVYTFEGNELSQTFAADGSFTFFGEYQKRPAFVPVEK